MRIIRGSLIGINKEDNQSEFLTKNDYRATEEERQRLSEDILVKTIRLSMDTRMLLL